VRSSSLVGMDAYRPRHARTTSSYKQATRQAIAATALALSIMASSVQLAQELENHAPVLIIRSSYLAPGVNCRLTVILSRDTGADMETAGHTCRPGQSALKLVDVRDDQKTAPTAILACAARP
jgi:hypothetical protein